jgi:hypothetical protein
MTLIKTRIHITENHQISGTVPADVPAGDHDVVIAIRARPRFRAADPPVHPSGWDDRTSLRREDLYGDDGR